MSAEKDPVFVESGRRAARARWGPPRILRLDALTPNQRALVTAILDATEKADPAAVSGSALDGGTGDVPPSSVQ